MLLILEISLNRLGQMTADGLHHTFRPPALPTPHTVRPFIGRLVDELQIWAEGLRGRPGSVELAAIDHFCSRCGRAKVTLPDVVHLHVKWVIVDGDWSTYQDGSWLAQAADCCQDDLLPAYTQSAGRGAL